MLRDFLTPEAFEIGIIRYLKRFSYQNTVSQHLWESLSNVSVLCARVGGSEMNTHLNDQVPGAACLILSVQRIEISMKDDILNVKSVLFC